MNLEDIQIRETTSDDYNNIMEVEKSAFGYDKEAKLVSELLSDKTAEPLVSLLAFYKGEPVGHILFTRAYHEDHPMQQMLHILAPLAVVPSFQRMGIGGLLIKAGIKLLKQRGSQLVFVLGHKEYYPKYGFIPRAANLGFAPPYPMPDEYADYWMVQALGGLELNTLKGKIRCSDMLNRLEHWRDDESDR